MKNFTSVKPTTQIVKPTLEQETDTWALPTVEGHNIQMEEQKTNAFGKKSNWRYEPPEEDEPEIMPLTAEEIEEIRQAAHDEGFNQGKEQGFEQGYEEGKRSGHEEGLKLGHQEGVETGLAEGKETIDNKAKQWQQIIDQLHQPIKEVENNVEQQLLQLVIQLTEAITLHEAKTNPDILLSAIKAGIKALPTKDSQIQILVHPEDIKLLEERFSEQEIEEHGWRLVPVPNLSQGSCQIENSTSNIDLTLQTRIKEVLDSFLQEALHQ